MSNIESLQKDNEALQKMLRDYMEMLDEFTAKVKTQTAATAQRARLDKGKPMEAEA